MTMVLNESEEISPHLLRPLLDSVQKENRVMCFASYPFHLFIYLLFRKLLFHILLFYFVNLVLFHFRRLFHLFLGPWGRK